MRRDVRLNVGTRSASRKTSRAERLLWLEREDDRMSRALHALTRERQAYHEEARSLRMALTAEDRALYDALRSMRAPGERRAREMAACARQGSEA